ncbi:MAG TPA: DUF4010 domain-containing protein [Williamwhitmania sp.]|nr:DUF4010 domain-containing protein [Williamwhitmania sp.]
MGTVAEIFDHIPADIIKFVLVTLFSLLIGLEQRRHHIEEQMESLFGTDRTFTVIGILGFILYIISPQNLTPFLGGGGVIALLLGIFYYQKIQIKKQFGFTSLVIALITYCLAPIVYTQPAWMVILVVVAVLIITEIKESLFKFSKKFDNGEFITLAKFLVVAGVILPLLPDTPISAEINISPYKFWLAIVAVSAISYLSYLLKKFVFPDSGIILTGILGGLYSSTATTIILARKSKEMSESNKLVAAIILATTMMYLRIFLLALFFNKDIALRLAPSFAIFIVASALIALFFLKFHRGKPKPEGEAITLKSQTNPLEFKTALVFAALFIFFGTITGIINKNFGTGGINVLSFVVGVTDIDPFILNLFQSKWNIESAVLVMAVLNAITSNNLLKMVYGLSFGDKSIRKPLIAGFSVLVVLGLILSFVIHL